MGHDDGGGPLSDGSAEDFDETVCRYAVHTSTDADSKALKKEYVPLYPFLLIRQSVRR